MWRLSPPSCCSSVSRIARVLPYHLWLLFPWEPAIYQTLDPFPGSPFLFSNHQWPSVLSILSLLQPTCLLSKLSPFSTSWTSYLPSFHLLAAYPNMNWLIFLHFPDFPTLMHLPIYLYPFFSMLPGPFLSLFFFISYIVQWHKAKCLSCRLRNACVPTTCAVFSIAAKCRCFCH